MGNVKRYHYRERTRVTWLSRHGVPCKQDFSDEETAMAHRAQLKRAGFKNVVLIVPPDEKGSVAGDRSAASAAEGGSAAVSVPLPRVRSGRKRSRPSDRAEAEPTA